MRFFRKDKVKLKDKALNLDTMKEENMPSQADDCINLAFKSCQEIAKGLAKSNIAEPPFFYLFYIDLLLELVMFGRCKLVLHYLEIFKQVKEERKKHIRDLIFAKYKKTPEREQMLDVLSKI